MAPLSGRFVLGHLKFAAAGAAAIALVLLGFRVAAFVHIFFHHAGTALTQPEILAAHADHDARVPAVPRITHQIFHNWTHPEDETLPEDWALSRQSCIDTNEDWEHWLWTEPKSSEFLREEYPWFLPTYDNFKFPVQKVDALRYFLMRHYGGIYIDLDNGCKTSLEPLRYYPAWTTDGGHGALSNNILGAAPNHPYWIMLTDSIIPHAWNYPLPFLTITYATGQWFLTKIWEEFHQHLVADQPVLTRVMMDGRPGAAPWVFFNHGRGGTWDNWDNNMFWWIGRYLGYVVVMVVVVAVGSVVACAILVRMRRRNRRVKSGVSYELVPPDNFSVSSDYEDR